MNISRFYPIPKVSKEPSKFEFRKIQSCSAYAVSMIVASYGLLMMGFLGSCSENFQVDSQFSDPKDAVVRFQINTDTPKDATTRSVNEDQINNLHVLVYNSAGELTGKSYTTFSGTTYTVSVSTRSGTGCKIYVIANTGNPALFDGAVANSEAKLKAMTTNLATWSTFNNTSGTVYLPMSGSTTADIAPGSTSLQGGISVKRLVAKVSLNVSIASGSGVTISGYRIYGIPGRSYYVAHPLSTEDQTTDSQTTRAEDASVSANAANWINSGLVSLSNVTSFSTDFYTYENRAGVNSTITAQNGKVKANAPGAPADSAAYVIIYGKATGYSNLSWKVYLGANNTTNFNLKRNCKYTCTVTLKANSSDMRIDYSPKIIWAGSNIYWDGTKLTFDLAPVDPVNPTTDEVAKMKKQGVFFKWGSLVGVSPGLTGSSISYSSSTILYVSTYNKSQPTSTVWNSGGSSGFTNPVSGLAYSTWTNIDYINDNVSSSDPSISNYLNADAQNSDDDYAARKGDICRYLSKIGAVSGSWRMPTSSECTNWASQSLTDWGTWVEKSNSDATGQTSIVSGATRGLTSLPASGDRSSTNGTLAYVNNIGDYWSASAYSGASDGYHLYFYDGGIYPAKNVSRQYAFPVRCVRN